ncbi:MAG TPA: adenylyltransferase/cytidyltransferase family protein [Bacillota bacterium]|nr:adenylyltransferase/cytidyltransferase family protein [Bacillota bacterium]
MKKYSIGYTTGVFDLFHIGHLNILKRAKENCDYLIVGVSTDELVREYKNKTPVIPFDERIAIVSAIKYVDEVVPQTSLDKFEAWKDLRYDVLFHGDDWKGSKLYGDLEKKLNSVGVDLVFFPYTSGTSSTKLSQVLDLVLEN